jgi:hypothetical protein
MDDTPIFITLFCREKESCGKQRNKKGIDNDNNRIG